MIEELENIPDYEKIADDIFNDMVEYSYHTVFYIENNRRYMSYLPIEDPQRAKKRILELLTTPGVLVSKVFKLNF